MDSLILYSIGCTNCAILKQMLVSKNMTFIENNSVEDMLALNIDRLPVLSVNGKLLDYDAAKKYINLGDKQIEEQ